MLVSPRPEYCAAYSHIGTSEFNLKIHIEDGHLNQVIFLTCTLPHVGNQMTFPWTIRPIPWINSMSGIFVRDNQSISVFTK